MNFDYRELEIWSRSMKLVEMIYLFLKSLPDDEKFGLISQMKRSAVSIPSNIAEGKMRSTGKDFRLFLFRALGSAAELETQLELCDRLKLGDKNQFTTIKGEIRIIIIMIQSFISKIKII